MKSAAIRKDEPPCQTDGSEDVNMSDQLEVRVARIESDVQHINEVTTDLRVELRRTNDRIDVTNKRIEEVRDVLTTKIDDRFNALDKKIDDRYNALDKKFDSLKDKLHSVTVWAVLLYIALAGTLLTVLAKGFKWI
jgi:uncharacterized coiled-coil protein SlyX